MRVFYVLLFWLLSGAVSRASPNNSVQLKLGMLSATLAGQLPRTVSNAPTWMIEYGRYARRDLSYFGGYRKATDSESGRNLYQGVSGGVRYYPLSLGVPINDKIFHNVIDYDFSWKTYAEAGLSMGRYLLVTLDNPAIFEVSSDVFGIFFGLGGHWQLVRQFALDFSLSYEQISGTSDHVEFSGSHTVVQMGSLYYF